MNLKTSELTKERWERAQSLFDAASQMSSLERSTFLKEQCKDDPRMGQYVESLVMSAKEGGSSIKNVISEAVESINFSVTQSLAIEEGSSIGAYQIVRLLGEGGMGLVYLAERNDGQFQQKVAIKVGRLKLTDSSTYKRLTTERQILANLEHPNISRLIDGGIADGGVPYIVMEYVDGLPIDEYCDKHLLNIRQRLKLFTSICKAVHYAHQHLVIHRDIKMSNIMITKDGVVKLLDFGIAKLIDSDLEAQDGLTRDGVMLMTPENAAPEQLLAKAVTTSTDVYALGLLLHQLVCGLPMFEIENFSPHAIAKKICEDIPLKPSERINLLSSKGGDELQKNSLNEIANHRSATPEQLVKRLRGDVDNIVLMATRKEPSRRYWSANLLGQDVFLHLNRMPIVARADSRPYLIGKFVERHIFGVAASVITGLLILVFAVTVSFQNQQILKERNTAQETSIFLEEIFLANEPANTRGLDITAREILKAGALRISTDLSARPEVQSALMETIGRVYLSLGEYNTSTAILEKSLSLRLASLGTDHPVLASVKNELAKSLTKEAKYDRAHKLLIEALGLNKKHLGDYSDAVAENYFNLAELELARGNIKEAKDFANASIAIYDSLKSEFGINLAEAKNTLARIYQFSGDLEQTEKLLREAISIFEKSEGSDHPAMAYYLQNLGVLLISKGDLNEAEVVLTNSIEVTKRVLGEKHDLLAATLAIQGSLLQRNGSLTKAETALREALALEEEIRGDQHPYVGYDLTSLAMVLHDQGKFGEALNALNRALTIYSSTLKPEHQYIASALTEKGAVLNSMENPVEAIQSLNRAIKIRSLDYGPESEILAATQSEYASSLVLLGHNEAAMEILIPVYNVLRSKDNRRSKRAYNALVRLYRSQGNQAAISSLDRPGADTSALGE